MIDTEILQDYTSEARELLDEMDNSLMRLEKEGPVPELLNNVFRAVHCIKGSAQYIGLESSSTLTHGVENLLDRLREGVMALDPNITDFLFRAKDVIAQLIDEVGRYREEKSDVSGLMEQLEAILTGSPLAVQIVHPAAGARPPSAPPVEEFPKEFEFEAPSLRADEPALPATPFEEELEEELVEPVLSLGPGLLEDEDDEQIEEMSYAITGFEVEDSLEETQSLEEFSVLAVEEARAASERRPVAPAGQVEEEPDEEEPEAQYELIESPSGEPLTQEGWDPTETLEGTVSRLLSVSLYIDDLQDGFLRPGEIGATFLKELDQIKRSMAVLGLPEAVDVVDAIEQRFKAIDPNQEPIPHEDIEIMKELLYDLRPFYPERMFPLEPAASSEPGAAPLPVAEAAAPPSSPHPPPPQAPEEIEEGAEDVILDTSGLRQPQATEPGESVAAPPAEILPTVARERSMLADVDDDLLNEFEGIFSEPAIEHPVASAAPVRPMSTLLDGLDVLGEDADREIIEIFLSYGFEVVEKLRPLIDGIARGAADAEVIGSAAELVKSIHSSSTYMDYQKVASFLDEWYERTLSAMERLGSLAVEDLRFMEENFVRFSEFLVSLQIALHPELAPTAAPPDRPVAAPVAASVGLVAASVSQDVPAIGAESPSTQRAVERFVAPEPAEVVPTASVPQAAAAPQAQPPAPAATPQVHRRPEEALPIHAPQVQTTPEAREEPSASPARPVAPALREERFSPPTTEAAAEPPRSQEIAPLRETQEGAVVKTMRVDSAKVDTLLNQIGELVVNRSYVEQLSLNLKLYQRTLASAKEIGKKDIQSLRDLSLKVSEASVALGRVVTEIQEGVMKLRMLPVGQLFNRMPRLIRDLSRRVGKSVALEVHGADTEVDKRVIEQIYNPLVHLIRNAVDHGIEDTETRGKIGKPEEGLIVLRAYSQGNQVSIDVEDDGAGIRSDAVLKRAVEHRLIEAQEVSNLSPQDVYNFLFLPGFSTSETVTRTSGRGVGMDVVKKDVEKINGHVEIESWEDQGTRISIKIPLTLAIIQTLLIRSARHVFAIPLTSVREIIQVSRSEIVTIEGFEVIKFREETIPVLRVSEIFNLKGHDPAKQARFLVLANAGLRTVGFLVEELIGEQDVVIKPLAEHIVKSRGLAGSTILGDGTIALVLDVTEIVDDVIAQQRQVAAQGVRITQQAEPRSLTR